MASEGLYGIYTTECQGCVYHRELGMKKAVQKIPCNEGCYLSLIYNLYWLEDLLLQMIIDHWVIMDSCCNVVRHCVTINALFCNHLSHDHWNK